MVGYAAAGIVGLVVGGYFLAPARFLDAALKLQRRAAGLRNETIQVGDHRIVYLDGGQGEPLVLLHGFGADRDNWPAAAKDLTPHFRVIAPDLPGFGESTHRANASYSLASQLERLHAFLQALDLGSVHLGGNSMGGYIAAHYAAKHPEAVKSLWLLAPAGVTSATPSEVLASIDKGSNPLIIRSQADFDRIIELCFVHPPYTPAAFRRVAAQRLIQDADFQSAVFDELFSTVMPFESALSGLPVRTLILWGDKDRILDVSGATILHALLPNSELRIMPDTGHVPMIEKPRESAAAFLAFQGTA